MQAPEYMVLSTVPLAIHVPIVRQHLLAADNTYLMRRACWENATAGRGRERAHLLENRHSHYWPYMVWLRMSQCAVDHVYTVPGREMVQCLRATESLRLPVSEKAVIQA